MPGPPGTRWSQGKHDEAGTRERWSEGLELFADEPEHLRLPEVSLTSVLVKDDNSREWTGA